MAEQKKSGKGKKFMVGLGVLAVIAIIIVVIVISIPPSTNSALTLLNKAYTNSFLMSQTEKTEYDKFQTKVDANKVNNYLITMSQEMKDVETLSITLAGVLDYYNDYLTFAQSNKNFNKNYKSIKNGLNGAIDSQKQLNKMLEEVNKLGSQSATYLQSAWIDFRVEYANWLNGYNKAISALAKAYEGSMGDVTTNNLASTTILNTVSDFTQVIYNDFAGLVEYDKQNPNANTYTYESDGKIMAFQLFVEQNLKNADEIENYYFSSVIQGKYQKINQYFSLYSQEDMKSAISSIKLISDNPVVTLTYEGVEDADNVYTKIKVFLIGGV